MRSSGRSAQRLSRVAYVTLANNICRALADQGHGDQAQTRALPDNNLKLLNGTLGSSTA